jgi:TPR repeat protein
MLVEGLGIKADKKEGANYLLKAAEADFPQAMYYVGNCYMNGDGLTKNAEQALKWYKLAAGKNNAHAQWSLAQCYRTGKGTTVNYDQALYWYAESLSKGYGRTFKQLITDSIPNSPFATYAKGMKAYYDKDYDAALKYFKVVEKAKITDGKVMEAIIFANSAYAKCNLKKSTKLFKEAAKTNAQAMYLLGMLYEAGKGVEQNMTTTVDYISKSAELGYSNAECALADMYYEGRGVDQNYATAVVWYTKADEQGQLTENAANRYASCYENGWGGLEINKDKAAEILKVKHRSQIPELLKII